MFKRVAQVCWALMAVVIAGWILAGGYIITKYQVPKTRMVEDAFGEKVEKTSMVDTFRFGLLPDKGYDGALPWILVLGVSGTISYGVHYKKRKSNEKDK